MVFFQKKNERAMDWLKEKNQKELEKQKTAAPFSPDDPHTFDDMSEESENKDNQQAEHKSLKNKKKGMEIEKHDMTALTLAAFLTFMPIAILILGLFALIAWLFF